MQNQSRNWGMMVIIVILTVGILLLALTVVTQSNEALDASATLAFDLRATEYTFLLRNLEQNFATQNAALALQLTANNDSLTAIDVTVAALQTQVVSGEQLAAAQVQAAQQIEVTAAYMAGALTIQHDVVATAQAESVSAQATSRAAVDESLELANQTAGTVLESLNMVNTLAAHVEDVRATADAERAVLQATIAAQESRIAALQVGEQPALAVAPNPAQDAFAQGESLRQAGNYRAAIDAYNHAIEMNPDDAVSYLARAIAFYELGDLLAALEDASAAIRLDDTSANAFLSRGWFRFLSGDYQPALEDYRMARDLAPTLAVAWVDAAIVQFELGADSDARVSYAEALSLNPALRYDFHTTPESTARYLGYVADYTRALAVTPQNIFALVQRGNAYAYLEDFDAALSDLSAAVDLVPDYAEPYRSLGSVYVALNQVDATIDAYQRYIDLAGVEADPMIAAQVELLLQAQAPDV